MNNIADRLIALRKEANLSQEAFGQRIGLSRSEIRNLEYGITQIKERTVPIICREFDINEYWLRTGQGEMFIQKSRSDEIAAFVGDILRDESDFRQKFISVLAHMTTDEWRLLEKKVLELAEEIKKTDS